MAIFIKDFLSDILYSYTAASYNIILHFTSRNSLLTSVVPVIDIFVVYSLALDLKFLIVYAYNSMIVWYSKSIDA